MVITEITRESSLILAVSSAADDLANSDALRFANQVDPTGACAYTYTSHMMHPIRMMPISRWQLLLSIYMRVYVCGWFMMYNDRISDDWCADES
jgi:hypothetical protein